MRGMLCNKSTVGFSGAKSFLVSSEKIISFCVLLIFTHIARSQSYYTISGYIFDHESGEALPNSSVYLADIPIGTNSNEHGFYSLVLPEGEYKIKTSYVGYMAKYKNGQPFRRHIVRFCNGPFAST